MYLWAMPAAEFDRRWPRADLEALRLRRLAILGVDLVGATYRWRPKYVDPEIVLAAALRRDLKDDPAELERRWLDGCTVLRPFMEACTVVDLDGFSEDDVDAGVEWEEVS